MSGTSMGPQGTGVKDKVMLLVWWRNPKAALSQSTGKTETTMGYQGLLENGRLEMKINTQIRPGSNFPSVKPLENQRTDKEN